MCSPRRSPLWIAIPALIALLVLLTPIASEISAALSQLLKALQP